MVLCSYNRSSKYFPDTIIMSLFLYSTNSLLQIVQTVVNHFELESVENKRIALLSTPSIYFSIPEQYLPYCTLLDFDPKFETSIQKLNVKQSGSPQFVLYNFNQPLEGISQSMRGTYTMIIVDPPFVTRDVWERYSETIQALKSEDVCQVMCTTIAENESMMRELMDLSPVVFRPNIPNLVYLYKVYTNFESSILNQLNTEIVL